MRQLIEVAVLTRLASCLPLRPIMVTQVSGGDEAC